MAASDNLSFINKIRADGRASGGGRPFIAGWEPVRKLGKGAFGRVYEVKHVNDLILDAAKR